MGDTDEQAEEVAAHTKKHKRAENVLVEFKVDRSGIFSARVIDARGNMKPNKNMCRIAFMILVICALIAMMFNNSLQRRNAPRIRTPFHEQVNSFVSQQNPDDASEVDHWVHTHQGREKQLVKHLEGKYNAKFEGLE